MILSKIKESAEAHLGCKLNDAVITVPAYFNDAQRQATKDAGKIAGLNVLRIINEPTAAAIAFGFNERGAVQKKKVLIFDLGGGTFDISILAIENGVFDVLSVTGDTHLGGQDFDNRMAIKYADEFERKHKLSIRENKRVLNRLRVACERGKRLLSSCLSTDLLIENIVDGIDFHTKMTRACFELCNEDLFLKMMKLTENAIKYANLQKRHIDEVVLVGGSSRIPKIRELLRIFFDGKILNEKINPDEAVAYGAAIQASILSDSKMKNKFQLHDVTPFSVGLETNGAKMAIVIARNSPLPAKGTRTFCTTADNQSIAQFAVYEGNHAMTRDNKLLGEFKIVGIPAAKAGVELFDVSFEIDENGILNIRGVNRSTGIENRVIIDKKRLNDDEMKTLISETERFQIEDRLKSEAILAKNDLESFCCRIKLLLAKPKIKTHFNSADCEHILRNCNDIMKWLDSSPNAEREEYDTKRQEFECICHPLFKRNDNLTMPTQCTSISIFGLTDIPD